MNPTPYQIGIWYGDLEVFQTETIVKAMTIVGFYQANWVSLSDVYWECRRIENLEPDYSPYESEGRIRLSESEYKRIASSSGLPIKLESKSSEQIKLEAKGLTDDQKTQLDTFEIRSPCRTGKAASMSQDEIEAERKRQIDATIAAFQKECEPKVKAGTK